MSNILLLNDEEATNRLNIDDLYDKNLKRDLKQLSIFNKILNRIHNRIKLTARNKISDKFIWFVIPEFIFGEPTYNQSDCIAYITSKIVDNGFYVKYIHPNTLFISWEQWIPTYVRNEVKKKTGKQIDEKGQVISCKGIGTIDETNGNELEISNSKIFNTNGSGNETKNDGKKQGNDPNRFTPIEKYKPTGKLVYNTDLFNVLNSRVNP
jgi:hypothetical protein